MKHFIPMLCIIGGWCAGYFLGWLINRTPKEKRVTSSGVAFADEEKLARTISKKLKQNESKPTIQ